MTLPPDGTIRPAEVGDRDAILAVVRAAFNRGDRDGHEEVAVVEGTWSVTSAATRIELVATRGDAIVGHALAAPGSAGGRKVLGIAPLCVAPADQGAGVGRALMSDLLDRIAASGEALVVLLGDPAFYGRFGFEPAWRFGITYRPVGPRSPHFLVRRFGLPGYIRPEDVPSGEFTYCWEVPPPSVGQRPPA